MVKASIAAAKRQSRAQERENRKEQLLKVAAELFLENGYDRTSMNDIAKAMGIKASAIYYYVDSKDELISLMFKSAIESLQREVIDRVRAVEDPEEKLRALMKKGIELCLRQSHVALLLDFSRSLTGQTTRPFGILAKEHGQMVNSFVKDVVSEFSGMIGDGTPIDPTIAVFAFVSLSLAVPKWYKPDGRLSEQELIDGLTEFYIRGFAGGDLRQCRRRNG